MIRLWLSKQARTPVREQLGAQLLLGILSGTLAPGERLPSVRALARQLGIHRNTVTAVYQDLAERGWLRLQRGSGAYVAERDAEEGLDAFVRLWAGQARALGYTIPDLHAALARLAETPQPRPWLVIDPDAELARIIAHEVSAAAGIEVSSSGLDALDPARLPASLLLVNAGNAGAVSSRVKGCELHGVRLKSVAEMVVGLKRPAGPVLIGLVSGSKSILNWAGTLLAALGFGPDSVVLRDAAEPGWTDGLKACHVVAGDAVVHTALSRAVPGAIAFRIVSEISLAELRALVTRQ
jgi:DNA-binding transcriptional regulator YhcF (GntR family)